jgi:phosphotransferase system  glucose/maltose/N-acetylglucosamine-specific IIC component
MNALRSNTFQTFARLLIVAVCLAIVLGPATAWACPGCKQALAEEGQGDLARGIYYSVLFMMSVPFAIVGTFSFVAYRAIQREKQRQADLAARRAEDDAN